MPSGKTIADEGARLGSESAHAADGAHANPTSGENEIRLIEARQSAREIIKTEIEHRMNDIRTYEARTRQEKIWFVCLKSATILMSAGTGVASKFDPTVALVLAALATALVSFDALRPASELKIATAYAAQLLKDAVEDVRADSEIALGRARTLDRPLEVADIFVQRLRQSRERGRAMVERVERPPVGDHRDANPALPPGIPLAPPPNGVL